MRILGFPLFSQRSQCFQHSLAKCAENTAIARKREENPEILTNLMRKRLARFWVFFRYFRGVYSEVGLFGTEFAEGGEGARIALSGPIFFTHTFVSQCPRRLRP